MRVVLPAISLLITDDDTLCVGTASLSQHCTALWHMHGITVHGAVKTRAALNQKTETVNREL